MPRQGNVLKIVTASTGAWGNVTSVIDEESSPGQAVSSLLFALRGQDDLHPAGPDTVVGEIVADEPDRIVVRQANKRHGGGWAYEFRGTPQDLEILHTAVNIFRVRVERARERAAVDAATDWTPTPDELEAAATGPELSSL